MSEVNTTIVTLSSEWQSQTVSKAGKVTSRSAVGVLLHGTTAEVRMLGADTLATLLANNSYRAALAELTHDKLFPAKALRKAPNLTVTKDGEVHLSFQVDADTLNLVRLNMGQPNKTMMRAYCQAVVWLRDTKDEAGSPLKGAKLAAANVCEAWLQAMREVDAMREATPEALAA